MHGVRRLALAVLGGLVGAALVALLEVRACVLPTSTDSLSQLFLADFGVLAPVCLVLSFGFGLVHAFIEPGVAQSPFAHFARIRSGPILLRSRTAALVPLVIAAAFVSFVFVAYLAPAQLAEGVPREAGAMLTVKTLATVAVAAVFVFALLPPMRRLLATISTNYAIDPVATGTLASALALFCFALGIRYGDVGGDGAWPLGIFGVFKRSELDLRPLALVILVLFLAYLATILWARRNTAILVLLAAALVVFSGWTTARAAKRLNASTATATAIEHDAPLGKWALAVDRLMTDRDRDKASAWFGGGDCDDRNPNRSPNAIDVPGNGLDEDCSGADTPKPTPIVVIEPPQKKLDAPADLNLVLITIDTLRPDLGFMGYEQGTSPNLDKLAQSSVVFDHAYSLASYTGKSIGPLLIGKYPSETDRDAGHFNKYAPSNVFVAERLHDAGMRTFGAASHWYFAPWSGLSQGMDVWDLSAKPSDGQGDTDTSITSEQISDAALKLLGKSENTSGRFFMWLHYFDPHEQYMVHPNAPDFSRGDTNPVIVNRGRYDGEVWFTDSQIGRVLDYIASQTWGKNTAIIVTSDHGEAFGEHNMYWHGGELWECLVHVPLVIYVPGNLPHHVPVKRSHVDLVPTILETMHVSAKPGDLRGRSLLPDILGEGPYEERDVFIDMPLGPFTMMRKALITGKTPGKKLIYSGGTNYQVFDLENDPDEKHDLTSDPSVWVPMRDAFEQAKGRLQEVAVKPD